MDDINLGLQHFYGAFNVAHARLVSSGVRPQLALICFDSFPSRLRRRSVPHLIKSHLQSPSYLFAAFGRALTGS